VCEHILIVGSDRHLAGDLRGIKPGTRTSVLCRLEFAPRIAHMEEHTRIILLQRGAPESEWIAHASAVNAVDPITRLASFEDRDQRCAALIGDYLGLATHAAEVVDNFNNKLRMRATLAAAGVDDTAATTVLSAADLAAFASDYGMPIVAKPVFGEASEGVTVVRSADGFERAYQRASAAAESLGTAGVMAEQFHEGLQFSVEAFSEEYEHVVLATVRKFSDPDSLVEVGHATPAALDGMGREKISSWASSVLSTLGARFGPSHTELILSPSGPRVIESHLRMAGDDVPELIADTTGVNLANHVARQTMGLSVIEDIRQSLAMPGPNGGAAIWFAATTVAGRLIGVDGTSEARAVTGVRQLLQGVLTGEDCFPLRSSNDRLASARSVGDNAEEALTSARTAIAKLKFRIQVKSAIDAVF
jgi:biotin carboxylase